MKYNKTCSVCSSVFTSVAVNDTYCSECDRTDVLVVDSPCGKNLNIAYGYSSCSNCYEGCDPITCCNSTQHLESKIINLCQHVINLVDENGSKIADYQPSGVVARISEVVEFISLLPGNIRIERAACGAITGLPKEDPTDTNIYIVSGICLQAYNGNLNLVAPGKQIRNEAGQPVGCLGFRIK